MLAIPYLGKDNQPLTVRFRCIQDHDHDEHFHGKYNSLKGDPTRVYNIGAIHRAEDEMHITEGEFDAIVLNKLGLPAIAIPGVNNWKHHHRRMLAGFSRVYVWGDPDDAGAEFVQRLTQAMRQASGVNLRDGDVTETYLQKGAAGVLSLIKRKDTV